MLRRPSCGDLFKTVFSGDGFLLGRCSICPSDTVHPATAAFRTDMDVNVPYRFQEFCHGKASVFFPETLTPLKRKDQFQVFTLSTIVQEPIIADFLKAMRKHMHQITADKFRVIQSDHAFWVAGLFPTGGKDSPLSVNGKDPAVGDGNLMCIPSKVFDCVAKSVKCFFYVRAPVLLVKGVTEFCPVVRVTQLFTGSRKKQFFVFMKGIKGSEVFPFKLVTEYLDRDKKAAGRLPYFMVFCQSAARDDTVHMHMVIDLLVPGVEDLDDSGCCAEIFLIRR